MPDKPEKQPFSYFLRQIGFGFGFRYTLLSTRNPTSDGTGEMARTLDETGRKQDELQTLAAWSPDPADESLEVGMQRYFRDHGFAGRDLHQEAQERVAKRGQLSPTTMVLCALLAGISILIGWAAISRAHAETCAIKGNISRGGAHIYHLPGSTGYAATIISERTGERWFYLQSEAKTAGWWAAKQREAKPKSTSVPRG